MLRRNHLSAIFALTVSFFATLTLSSFGDPGDPAPGLCPAEKVTANPTLGITDYWEDPMSGQFGIDFYALVSISCADTPSEGSCCGYCMIVVIYRWNDVLDEYTYAFDSGVAQTAATGACGKSKADSHASGHYDGFIGSDYKIIIKVAKYDCRLDDDDICCYGCQNPSWSSEATEYIGTAHD